MPYFVILDVRAGSGFFSSFSDIDQRLFRGIGMNNDEIVYSFDDLQQATMFYDTMRDPNNRKALVGDAQRAFGAEPATKRSFLNEDSVFNWQKYGSGPFFPRLKELIIARKPVENVNVIFSGMFNLVPLVSLFAAGSSDRTTLDQMVDKIFLHCRLRRMPRLDELDTRHSGFVIHLHPINPDIDIEHLPAIREVQCEETFFDDEELSFHRRGAFLSSATGLVDDICCEMFVRGYDCPMFASRERDIEILCSLRKIWSDNGSVGSWQWDQLPRSIPFARLKAFYKVHRRVIIINEHLSANIVTYVVRNRAGQPNVRCQFVVFTVRLRWQDLSPFDSPADFKLRLWQDTAKLWARNVTVASTGFVPPVGLYYLCNLARTETWNKRRDAKLVEVGELFLKRAVNEHYIVTDRMANVHLPRSREEEDEEMRLYLTPLEPTSPKKLAAPDNFIIEEKNFVVDDSIVSDETIRENERRLDDFQEQARAFINAEPDMIRDNLLGKWVAFVGGERLAIGNTHPEAVENGRKRYREKNCYRKRMLFVDQVGRDRKEVSFDDEILCMQFFEKRPRDTRPRMGVHLKPTSCQKFKSLDFIVDTGANVFIGILENSMKKIVGVNFGPRNEYGPVARCDLILTRDDGKVIRMPDTDFVVNTRGDVLGIDLINLFVLRREPGGSGSFICEDKSCINNIPAHATPMAVQKSASNVASSS